MKWRHFRRVTEKIPEAGYQKTANKSMRAGRAWLRVYLYHALSYVIMAVKITTILKK